MGHYTGINDRRSYPQSGKVYSKAELEEFRAKPEYVAARKKVIDVLLPYQNATPDELRAAAPKHGRTELVLRAIDEVGRGSWVANLLLMEQGEILRDVWRPKSPHRYGG